LNIGEQFANPSSAGSKVQMAKKMRPHFVTCLVIAALANVSCTTVDTQPLYRPDDSTFLNYLGLSAAAFSPSGQYAAVANFNTIWIFKVDSMKMWRHFYANDRFGTNNTLIFLDENRIASTAKTVLNRNGELQAAIKIWDISRATPIVIPLPELDRYAISLDYSESADTLAVGGSNGAVVLLKPDIDGRYLQESLPGLSGSVLALEFSRDGGLLAAGGVHHGVPIWDLKSLSEFGALPAEGGVYDLELIPGEQTLLVAGRDLKLWNFQSDDDVAELGNPSLAGDYIAIGTMTATYVALTAVVAMAGAFSGEATSMPAPMSIDDFRGPGYEFCKRETAVSPNGNYIVDVHAGKLKEKIRIVDIREDKVVATLNARGGNTCAVAFSPDGSKLLIANNRVARLYDVDTWDFEDFVLD
jgi:WD40 repeat protein